MKILVTTSDWYNPALPAFAHLFRRYWSAEQPVTVLGYSDPAALLPAGFDFVSLGAPAGFGNARPEWSQGSRGPKLGEPYPNPGFTDSLRPYFETLEAETFLLLQVDYFLNRPVRHGLVEHLAGYLGRDGVVKIDLSNDRARNPHTLYAVLDGVEGGAEVILTAQDANFRSSLQAALWRRDYFLRFLVPGRSPWEMENLGGEEARGDGALILGTTATDHWPVPYVNAYHQGRVDWKELVQIDESVLVEMFDRGLIGPHWNGWV